MVYAEAVDHLYALAPELAGTVDRPGGVPKPGRKFDLAHMRALCGALGDPQNRVPAVLIAGTNGKGSTAATLASILTSAGYRTGLYTSPHLVRVNERIQLSGPKREKRDSSAACNEAAGELLRTIADDDFARLYTRVDDVCERLLEAGTVPVLPSFFERVTAVAFLHFAERDAEIMVLEVGLGGRLDATNVVEPLLSVITDIALDHQEYLGDTIAEIAAEKCGILRRRGVLVTLPQLAEANTAIGLAAVKLDVEAVSAAQYIPAAQRNGERERTGFTRNCYTVSIGDGDARSTLRVDSPLPGVHQQRNIALAIGSAVALRNHCDYDSGAVGNRNSYKIPNAAIEAGIRSTCWPGRLEMIGPGLLLDVAHNPAGAWTLRAAIAELPQSRPRTLIFSCLRDKSLEEMSRIIFPLFDHANGDPMRRRDHVVLAPIANPRATPVEALIAAARALDVAAHAAPDLAEALSQARALTPSDGLIIATGSVYLVGEVRRLVSGETAW